MATQGLTGGVKQKNGTYSYVQAQAPKGVNVDLKGTQNYFGLQDPTKLANGISTLNYNNAMSGINSQRNNAQMTFNDSMKGLNNNYFSSYRSAMQNASNRGLTGGMQAGLANNVNMNLQGQVGGLNKNLSNTLSDLTVQEGQAKNNQLKEQQQLYNDFLNQQIGIAFDKAGFDQAEQSRLDNYLQSQQSQLNGYNQWLSDHNQSKDQFNQQLAWDKDSFNKQFAWDKDSFWKTYNQNKSQFDKQFGLDKSQFDYQKLMDSKTWSKLSPAEKQKMYIDYQNSLKLQKAQK
jgi:hypothetical protein